MPSPLSILYRSASILVVNKPAGLLTQAPPGIDSMEARIKEFLRGERAGSEEPYLGVPHRLDRPASGAMVFALDRPAARKISRQFERRQVAKTYWALASGDVQPDAGTWTDFLAKESDSALCRVVAADAPAAQLAILHYRVLGRTPGVSWLEIRLETGRYHQVRVQASSRGHALLGDELYGSQVPFGPVVADPRERTIALHARRLAFTDPGSKLPMDIVAPLSEPWREHLGDAAFAKNL